MPSQPTDRHYASQYDDAERTARIIARGMHRKLVGGLWEEMGQLQFDFLKQTGLKPHHKFLDVGCGSLRAGVKIIPYLDRNNYFGIDSEKKLIDVGYRVELKRLELQDRLDRANLYTSKLFKHGRLPDNSIDMGICNSVMTHLPLNFLRICLENTERYFRVGGRLFITFFEIPLQSRFAERHTNQKGVTTTGFSDPYHYYASDMIGASNGTKWSARYIGEWGHLRGQNIVEYIRL